MVNRSVKRLKNKDQIYIEHCIPSRIDHLVTIRSKLVKDLQLMDGRVLALMIQMVDGLQWTRFKKH